MANTQLHLEIVSPEGITFSNPCDEIIAPAEQGEIAILPNHAALFTKLSEGEVTVKQGNKTTHIAVLGGFLDISHNKVSILADYAVAADSINIAKAEEAKKRAEQLLKEKHENVDFVEIEKDLQRAILDLKIADKIRKRRVS